MERTAVARLGRGAAGQSGGEPGLRLAAMRSAILAMALLPAAASGSGFPQFWNVDEVQDPEVDVTLYGFRARNFTQVGDGCSQAKSANCSSWRQGLWPEITSGGEKINGGVPQAGNLSLHLEVVESTLPGWIPDPDWEGNAVLDFESWTTVWEQNIGEGDWHSARYQNESLRLANGNESLAKEQFEAAATRWFVETLMLCRKLRPKAKWGFYGLPLNAMNDCQAVTGKPGAPKSCGYSAAGSEARELRRAAEVTQLPIWRASTALFPSIYLATPFRNLPVSVAEAYVDSTVSESVKVAALAASADGLENPVPVFPYAWDHYHAGVHVLPKESLVANMQVSKRAGARGVVWWGSGRVAGNATYWAWFKRVEGPAVVEFCRSLPGGC